MTKMPAGAPQPDAPALATLRERIDTIDERVHGLLMERSEIIDALIAAKGSSAKDSTEQSGAAFRPAREADMMRRLVERHSGTLPVLTVEHIWREIITTFTRLQAEYVVHLDGSADTLEMRDAARFYFGFALELITEDDPDATVAAVAASKTDLGVIALRDTAASPWWQALGGENGPRILARLPFLLSEGRPADLPALVLAPPITEPVKPDMRILAASWHAGTDPSLALMNDGIEILTRYFAENGICHAVLACPGDLDDLKVVEALHQAGTSPGNLKEIGGYATPIDLDEREDEDL